MARPRALFGWGFAGAGAEMVSAERIVSLEAAASQLMGLSESPETDSPPLAHPLLTAADACADSAWRNPENNSVRDELAALSGRVECEVLAVSAQTMAAARDWVDGCYGVGSGELERELESELECSLDALERVRHAFGRSFRDVLRGAAGGEALRRACPHVVFFPATERAVSAVLVHATRSPRGSVVVMLYGGGSSVCGGVEAPSRDNVLRVSLDLSRLDRVLEVDESSMIARVQGGVLGPALESQLRQLGSFTLRHFPQSFEFSSVGGWVATRSGGHFATRKTRIDDFVAGVRVVTAAPRLLAANAKPNELASTAGETLPTRVVQTRVLPGSGAGVDASRFVCGSEGTIGAITEVHLRILRPPRFRCGVTVFFEGDDGFETGVRAVREISQSVTVFPSNCRLIDSLESLQMGLAAPSGALAASLLLAFESASHVDLTPLLAECLRICRDLGGVWDESQAATVRESPQPGSPRKNQVDASQDPAETWKRNFVAAPYLRDQMVLRGWIMETFETATTWTRFADLHRGVKEALMRAVEADSAGVFGGDSSRCFITTRFTHVYPDGPAPYFTVVAKPTVLDADRIVLAWDSIKEHVTTAVLENGGTCTHHHAVGRDLSSQFSLVEQDAVFCDVLRAAQRVCNPSGAVNEGILLTSADDEGKLPSSSL
jgi:alkyldihydroxyacetonephosphate synthase